MRVSGAPLSSEEGGDFGGEGKHIACSFAFVAEKISELSAKDRSV